MGKFPRKNSLMTVREVADFLHIHRNTVQRWGDRGVLQPIRITSRGDRRFRQEEVNKLLSKLKLLGGDERKAASIVNNATK